MNNYECLDCNSTGSVELFIDVCIEIYDGQLRVIVWSDIDQEDPTHSINLEGARLQEYYDSKKRNCFQCDPPNQESNDDICK